jgi:hypothetical protein
LFPQAILKRRLKPEPRPFALHLANRPTSDDDNEWRSTILRQKEAMKNAGRRKADEDRDAALARQLNGRPSPPSNKPVFGSSSQLGQNNAFDRILGRSSHTSPWTAGRTDRVKQEVKQDPGVSLATRPHALVKTEPGPFSGLSSHTQRPGSSAIKSEPAENGYRMPGSYVDSDDENDAFGTSSSRQPFGGLFRPSRPSAPSSAMYPFYDLTATAPTLPSMSQNFGANGTLRHNPNVPAIELARQSSMARHGTPPPWPPVGPIGQQLYTTNKTLDPTSNWDPSALGANRPGFMANGSYYSQPGPSGFATNLAATINRVNRFDFHTMTDGEGNPFGERLTNYLDDYVNDPRKTEADIKQLLSNIRPDMEVPEEERGETPDALRYPLYPHQQLALKWMMDMEEGTNKGGILADDMGLGKTVSTLALMVSRPAPDNTKVCNRAPQTELELA